MTPVLSWWMHTTPGQAAYEAFHQFCANFKAVVWINIFISSSAIENILQGINLKQCKGVVMTINLTQYEISINCLSSFSLCFGKLIGVSDSFHWVSGICCCGVTVITQDDVFIFNKHVLHEFSHSLEYRVSDYLLSSLFGGHCASP